MTDVIQTPRKPRSRPAHSLAGVAAPDPGLLALVEMLFFAYRDFTGEADAVLEADGLGRAHHRVLHFVNRHPGIRVADLLGILKITKQSLGRVLRKLIEDGWVEQKPGPSDRRERLLTLTPRGHTLAVALADLQTRRVAAALDALGPQNDHDARSHIQTFMFALIAADERAAVSRLIQSKPAIERRAPRNQQE